MPRVKDQTFQQLLGEIDPRKVAEIVDGYGLGVARERWHWAYAHIPQLAEEGRRMKAAGERWTRAPRLVELEPESPIAAPKTSAPRPTPSLAIVRTSPPPPPQPAPPVAAISQPSRIREADLLGRIERQAGAIRILNARVAELEAQLAARKVEISRPAPAPAPSWDFPISPDALLRMLRRTSLRMVAMTYRLPQWRVREAAALAQTLTKKAA